MSDGPNIARPMEVGAHLVVPGNRWDLVRDVHAGPPSSVTVVVPHYADERRLQMVLAGLELQDHPATRMDVVVADDGSPVPPRLPQWLRRPSPRLVRQADLGFRAAAARNLGAGAGHGDVLVFLDGDTVPAVDFVRRIAAWPAGLPDALVVGTRHHVDLAGWGPERAQRWLGGDATAPPPPLGDPQWLADGYRQTRSLLDADDRSYRFVISAVMACSRRLFDELGGFDPRFVGYGGEDWEFAFRAYNAGAVLIHEPTAVAWHDGPDQGARSLDPATKELERRRLDELVPVGREHGSGGQRYVDTVVSVAASGLRSSRRWRRIGPSWAGRDDVARYVGGPLDEPTSARVRAGAPPADVLDRCRFHVELYGPVDVGADRIRALTARLRDGSAGEVTVHAGGQMIARATSTRALRRSARWSPGDPRALIGRLFASAAVDVNELDDGDVTRFGQECDGLATSASRSNATSSM